MVLPSLSGCDSLTALDSLVALDSLAAFDEALTDSDEVAGATEMAAVALSTDIEDVLPGRIWRRYWLSRWLGEY